MFTKLSSAEETKAVDRHYFSVLHCCHMMSEQESLDIDAFMEAIDREEESNRFAFLDEDVLKRFGERIYSENTNRRITSVLKTFCEWRTQRNTVTSGEKVPLKLIEEFTIEEINKWAAAFLCEVRKVDGSEYKARGIFEMGVIIQMHLRACGKTYKLYGDPQFLPLRNCVDRRMKELQAKGLG